MLHNYILLVYNVILVCPFPVVHSKLYKCESCLGAALNYFEHVYGHKTLGNSRKWD